MALDTNRRALPSDALKAPTAGDERFAERRRIALLEYDPALRPVIIRTLLRLGCVVSAKRDLAHVLETLQTGPVDGVVLALAAADAASFAALQAANCQRVPVVVLTDEPVEPYLQQLFPSIHVLQKPFDARALLSDLGLPEKATILPSE
jgi:DNA-binding response OmpR family regulator